MPHSDLVKLLLQRRPDNPEEESFAVLAAGEGDEEVVGVRLRSGEFDSVVGDECARDVAYVLRGTR